MTEAVNPWPAAAQHTEAAANPLCCTIHGILLVSTFQYTPRLGFVVIYFFTFTMPPRGKGKKTRGASPSVSPLKQARKGAGRKQVPASTKETEVIKDLHCGGQTMDSNLNSMMNILVDIYS